MGEATGRPKGRPPGSMSKLAHEARATAQATGLLPHEILLAMARGEPIAQYVPLMKDGAHVVDDEGEHMFVKRMVVLDLEARRDAAKAAAPYYAPKISTVEVIAGVSDDDLDRIIASAAAEAGVGLGAAGEGEEDEGEAGDDAPSHAAPGGVGRERKRAIRVD